MRNLLLSITLILTVLPLAAQSSRVEVFGGFQYLRDGDVDGLNDGLGAVGWNAAATYYFSKHFGATADFSGSYRSATLVLNQPYLGDGGRFPVQLRAYTYTFGPVYNLNRRGRLRPFVHALFGAGNLRPNGCVIFSGSPDECGSGSYGGLTVFLGGGLDIAADRLSAFRILQVDWAHLPSFASGQNGSFAGQNSNLRISTGLVCRF
jgi:hypothetical protein